MPRASDVAVVREIRRDTAPVITGVRKFVPLLLLILVAAGCGSGSSSSGGGGTTAQAGAAAIRTITISETEFKLDPATVTIDKPGTYILKGANNGSVSHAIAIEGNGLDQDGPVVAPGKASVLKVTISKKGSYEIYCPVDGHKDKGMKGTLTLGSAPPASGGTSTGTSTGKGGSGY